MLLILNPSNLTSIVKAEKPYAMAHTVARRRFLNFLNREGKHCARVFNPEDTGDERMTNTKLDYFAAMRTDVRRGGKLFALREDLPDEGWSIPGYSLIWTKNNIGHLLDLMKEGFEKLDKSTPFKTGFSVSTAIKLKHGAYGDDPYTWRQLQKWCSSSRQKTMDQVRYAVQNGEVYVRNFITAKILEEIAGGGS